MQILNLDTWEGTRTYPVEIVDETPERYRIKTLTNVMLPNRKFVGAGQTVLVPKYAVTEADHASEIDYYNGHVYGYAKSNSQRSNQSVATATLDVGDIRIRISFPSTIPRSAQITVLDQIANDIIFVVSQSRTLDDPITGDDELIH